MRKLTIFTGMMLGFTVTSLYASGSWKDLPNIAKEKKHTHHRDDLHSSSPQDHIVSPGKQAWNTTGDVIPLRELAERRKLFLGAEFDVDRFHEARYLQVHNDHYNLAVPASDLRMKMIVKKGRDRYRFSAGDAAIKQAKANGQKVHGHVLVYQNALPDWLTNGRYSRDELLQILETYVRTVVKHYRGKVDIWDVTNELWDSKTGDWKPKLLYRTIGPDFARLAFIWAHEEDPAAELILNGNEYTLPGPGFERAYATVQEWKRQGVPIHGIGIQMHLRLDHIREQIDLAEAIKGFTFTMQKFADLGLKIHITECDVAIDKPVTKEKLDEQAHVYAEVLKVCLAQPQCVEFTTWGFTDKYSWINIDPIYEGKYAAGLPFDENYHPKPAYFAILHELQSK